MTVHDRTRLIGELAFFLQLVKRVHSHDALLNSQKILNLTCLLQTLLQVFDFPSFLFRNVTFLSRQCP